jgi:NAD(P)-dependent dehydrogenase (short-subunit alcohol dehydrogenase family)
MTTPTPRTWFITGVSSGLGKALAEAALAIGDHVAGTVRREADKSAFEALGENAIGLLMDVTDQAAVQAAVTEAQQRLGRIDVLVNNAGYGLMGAIEEVSLDEIRAQFEANVLGPLAVIQAALPDMRARGAGRILNVTSVSGLAAWGGSGVYNASKFAIEGATQALAQEVAEFGIKVSNICPGGLRTDYGGRSLRLSARTVDAYAGKAGHLPRKVMVENAGHEKGDPAKAAQAILKLAALDNPPMHLLLGQDAVHYATLAAGRFQIDLSDWLDLTLSIAFDKP